MEFALIRHCAALSGVIVALVLLIAQLQASLPHLQLLVHVVMELLVMEFALISHCAALSGDSVVLALHTAERQASLCRS